MFAAASPVVFADIIGGWELVLLFAVMAILFGVKIFPRLGKGLGKGIEEFGKASKEIQDEFDSLGGEAGRSVGGIYGKRAFEALTPDNTVAEIYLKPDLPETKTPYLNLSKITLFLAQGFGVGRMPSAPGTFGSMVGFLPFTLLLGLGNFWLYVAGVVILAFGAVPICGRAEVILKQKDPGSIVLDEIVAIPLCFLSWVALIYFRTGALPSPSFFVQHWPMAIGVFVAFRFFDVLKPWPLRQSQNLPAGWGVVVDDLLAAVYVNLLIVGFWIIRPDFLQ